MKAFYTIALLLSAIACKNNSNAADNSKPTPVHVAAPAKTDSTPAADGSIAITVDGEGYHPSTDKAPAGKKAKLVFTRTTDKSCGTEVVFHALNIKKELPLNQPTTVEVDIPASGQLAFACGMDMMKGSVVVDVRRHVN